MSKVWGSARNCDGDNTMNKAIFEFREATNFICVEVLGRSYPNALDYWDGNWLEAHLSAEIPGFKVNCPLSIRTDELHSFLTELRSLYSILQGKAQFRTMEEGLQINLEAGKGGHIELKAKIQFPIGTGAILELGFEIDQTYLPSILNQVEIVISCFPIVGQLRMP